jgi:hypothetical protein
MPFMLVHPAAALPCYRRMGRYGVLSALIIGSLTPDMHYFLPLAVEREAAHSASGLIWFCWPVGIALYLLYHLLLKHPLALLLPPSITSRVAPWLSARLPDASWRAVSISLLVGAATHITWDAFTHQHAPVVMAVSGLRSVWFTVGNYPLAGYVVLQQASNVLGFSLLATWWVRWLRSQPTPRDIPVDIVLAPNVRYLVLGSVLISSLAMAIMAMRSTTAPMELTLRNDNFKQAALVAMSTAALALLIYSLLWQLRTRRRRAMSLQS